MLNRILGGLNTSFLTVWNCFQLKAFKADAGFERVLETQLRAWVFCAKEPKHSFRSVKYIID